MINQNAVIPKHLHGQRLDSAATFLFEEYSRSMLQKWIRRGDLKLNHGVSKPKSSVSEGDILSLVAEIEDQTDWEPQDLPLNIVYEDNAVLVIDKPADMVVHPAVGNYQGTVVNALLYHYPDMRQLPRAGIVHRLDKNTTGLMVVARTLTAHHNLVAQLQQRSVSRLYKAITEGVMTAGGRVEAPVGRHPVNRLKMAVTDGGKHAVTHYRIAERFAAHTLVDVKLETGRTHQIRVHMQHINFPLLGDTLYGSRSVLPPGASVHLTEALRQFKRQALHAWKLAFVHPDSRQLIETQSDMPQDMQNIIEFLRQEQD